MALVHKTVLVHHSARQLFDLVDGVEEYPQFLPWCGGTELITRTGEITAARIHIHYHGLRAHFATENSKDAPHHMHIRLTEGPFRHLEGAWTFKPLNAAACKVEFVLQYEFSSRLLEKALGPVFSHIASTFVDSFVKRAKQIHG